MERNDLMQLLGHVLGFYLAIGMMLVGYAYMFSGKAGGARAAHFYFAGSIRWTAGHVWGLILAVLTTVCVGIVTTVRAITYHAWRGVRWLFTHRRAPARARNTRRFQFTNSIQTAAAEIAAAVKSFARRYVSLHSLPFLLCLLCVVIAVFVICLVLLRGVLE